MDLIFNFHDEQQQRCRDYRGPAEYLERMTLE